MTVPTNKERRTDHLADGAPPLEARAARTPEEALDVPPLTFSLLGRFFAVPLLIISTIVGGAILVVLLFGGPASPDRRTIAELLQALESNGGERSMGLLLPREKELWQTALELTIRLENKQKDAELKDADLAVIAGRLGEMVSTDLPHLDDLPSERLERERQFLYRSERLRFLILALGRTERPEAAVPLLSVLNRADESYAAAAIQGLGCLHQTGVSSKAIEGIVSALGRASRSETKLMACTVLSVLADSSNAQVLEALASSYRKAEGDVEWNCALALARLGDATGRATVLELMDRSYLQRDELYEATDPAGRVHRYALPPQRVEEILIAAAEAGGNLNDPDVWERIRGLSQSDPSPAVRERAAAVLRKRDQAQVRPRWTMEG